MKSCLLLFALHVNLLVAQDFSNTMKTIFKGNQFKNFQWLNYPINDFGVGTSYKTDGNAIDNRGFLCSTFTCLSITPTPEGDNWMQVKGKAAVVGYANPACGGEIDASLKKDSKLAASAFLPKLLSIVGLTASVDRESGVESKLVFSSACSRMLISGKYRSYVRSITEDEFELKKSFQLGKLVVVVGDVVVSGLGIEVKPSSKLKVDIEAKLQGAADKTFGEGAKGTVNIARGSNGTYKLSSKSPMIVGLLAVKQKNALTSSDKGWESWQPIVLPEPPFKK